MSLDRGSLWLRYRSGFPYGAAALTLCFRKSCNLQRGDLVSICWEEQLGWKFSPRAAILQMPAWSTVQGNKITGPQHGNADGRGIASAFMKQVQKMPLIQPLSCLSHWKAPTNPRKSKSRRKLGNTPGMLMWCTHSCTLALGFELWRLEIRLAGQCVPRRACWV